MNSSDNASNNSHIDLDSYKSYLLLINKFEKLTNKEQSEMLLQINDVKVEEKTKMRLIKRVFKSNLRLVTNIANKYKTKGLPFMDIIHEGNAGLLKSIEKFDPSRGFQLSTCSYIWITQHIERFISDKLNLVRLSIHLSDLKNKILKKINSCKLNQIPLSIDELSTEFQISKKKIRQLFSYKDMNIISENSSDTNEKNDFFNNFIDEEVIDIYSISKSQDSYNIFNHIIENKLNEIEKYIIEKRYLSKNSKSFQELSEELDLKVEEIRKMNNRILQKIKKEYKKYTNN